MEISPTGRTVSAKEQTEIRTDLRQVLKNSSREDLLSLFYGFMWGSIDKFKDFGEMKKAQFAAADLTDRQIINKILDRDVKEIIGSLEKGYR